MLKHLKNPSKNPIGIDIGSYAVRMVQLADRGGQAVVTASAFMPIDPSLPLQGPARDQAIVVAITQAMASGDFKGNRVVTSLSARHVIYKNIRIPVMPPDEIKQAVSWEASDRLHLSLDDVDLQYLNVGEVRQGSENKQEIIVLAAKKQAIKEHLNLLEECHLIPFAIETAPTALSRWANYLQSTEQFEEATVILDLGYDSSKILICRQGRVLFYKQLDSAGRQINESLASKLNMNLRDVDDSRIAMNRTTQANDDEPSESIVDATKVQPTLIESMQHISTELTREISLCLRYFCVTFRGHRPERAWVTGGLSRDPQFLKMIQENSGLMLDAPPVLANQSVTQGLILACGLAMRLPNNQTMQRGQAA